METQETSEQLTGERDPHGWDTAGRRGGKNNLQLAKTLVYFERKRLQRRIVGEWDAQLNRDIDRLHEIEALLAEGLN